MTNHHLFNTATSHLHFLCERTGGRSVGSPGNIMAADYIRTGFERNGWRVEQQSFDAFDWESEGAFIVAGDLELQVRSSPYSEPCEVEAEVLAASSPGDLENLDARNKILILRDELCMEQLMPKNFIFYNPDHHRQIVALLEQTGAAALVFIVPDTGNYEGGEYPYPVIEDGDFPIPSVYLTGEEGSRLQETGSKRMKVTSKTRKKSSSGSNIIGRKGSEEAKRITLTAHLDAKKGSPGAIDNATGIVALQLLSELLSEKNGALQLELVALNGEDYYSVPGQMAFIQNKGGDFSDTLLNINMDGAGFHLGQTAYSLMELSADLEQITRKAFSPFPGLVEGKPWVQGDHSIFLQMGVPAIAISSEWLLENLQNQQITHTEKDHPGIVDPDKIVELAMAVSGLTEKINLTGNPGN